METPFDRMLVPGRGQVHESLLQGPMANSPNPLPYYHGPVFGVQDCFPAINEIVTPLAGLPVTDPFELLPDHYCLQQHHQYWPGSYTQSEQPYMPVLHYENDQGAIAITSKELEIPDELTWLPTPISPSTPALSPTSKDDQTGAHNSPAELVTYPQTWQIEQPRQRETKVTAPRAKPASSRVSRGRNRSEPSLEKTRKASLTSRKKSKEWLQNIEAISKQLEAQHQSLKAEHARLLQETLQLKSDLICHAKCQDARLDAWINNEARKFVGESGNSGYDERQSPAHSVALGALDVGTMMAAAEGA